MEDISDVDEYDAEPSVNRQVLHDLTPSASFSSSNPAPDSRRLSANHNASSAMSPPPAGLKGWVDYFLSASLLLRVA